MTLQFISDTSGLNLPPNEYNIIKGWFPNNVTFKRLYSSRDDRRTSHVADFQRLVAGFANTIIIIITASNGLKFGGYLHPAWNFTHNSITYDPTGRSFIFSLKPFSGQPRQYAYNSGKFASIGISSYGVHFGYNDLFTGKDTVHINNAGQYVDRGIEFIGTAYAFSLVEAYQVLY